MGEAKRRQSLAGTLIQKRDSETHELVDVKLAGMSYTEFDKYAANFAGRSKEDTEVPCRGCTACCHSKLIAVDTRVEPPERLLHLCLEDCPGGDKKLMRRDDGACVHLGDQGCTVYEHRPTTCRTYDCRFSGFLGVNYAHTPEQVEPVWQFDVITENDKILRLAIQVIHGGLATEDRDQMYAEDLVAYVDERMLATIDNIKQLGLKKISAKFPDHDLVN